MRILQVHNRYQQSGGEDVVVSAELELLLSYGHEVKVFGASNDSIKGITKKVRTAWGATYSVKSRADLASEIARFRPDVVHAHNLFPLLSPSIFDACQEAGVPVVQTLHNFRLICPGALLLRDNMVCEECIERSALRAVAHRCYRRNLLGSLAVARMVNYHRKHLTWRDKVDQFIALTEFAKDKFVQAKFPEDKITVKPNFINCDEKIRRPKKDKTFALFVGRLSEEKGVEVMIGAWERISGISLKIVGDGPLGPLVANRAGSLPDIEWLGNRSRAEVMTLMKEATMLVFPSTCYEGLPLTILEAFASGLPVIASGHGSMSALIDHLRTGLHFRPGDPGDLAEKVKWAFSHAAEVIEMGSNAQCEFASKYTAAQNYRMLLDIYESAIRNRNLNSR